MQVGKLAQNLNTIIIYALYIYTEKNGCLELTSRCLTMGQPSYMFSCNI